MTDVTLWWKAYGFATSTTKYNVYSDAATPNVFLLLDDMPLDATDRGDTEYSPYTTTLAAALSANEQAMILADATNFGEGDRARVDKETILLDGKDGDTFASVLRGRGATIDRDHGVGVPVFAMHETHTDAGVDFGGRHVIRYQIKVLLPDDTELVAAEAVAVKPSPPPTNDLLTVWGIEDSLAGQPQAGVSVSMSISEGVIFNPGTGESFSAGSISTTTDASGYWELFVPRDVARSGGALNLNVGGRTRTLARVPDVDEICYLECI